MTKLTLGLAASLLILGCFSAIMASYSSRVISCKQRKMSMPHKLHCTSLFSIVSGSQHRMLLMECCHAGMQNHRIKHAMPTVPDFYCRDQ